MAAELCDFKFSASDEKLLHYLRNRVETGKEGFIKDMKLYEDEPWLLPHVNNKQFKEKHWFYFVKRTRLRGKTPKRTVPGRGDSLGGTWTTTGLKKKEIRDRNENLIGFKTKLGFYKKIKEEEDKEEDKKKPDKEATGWCMTEYWLNDDVFQQVVLCHLREKKKTKEQFQLHSSRFGPVQDSMAADHSDLKFSPADERLIGFYLRNRVDSGRDGFVTDINLYEDEPWFLPHVNNDMFEEKEWFYFVVRTLASGKRPNRVVQGKGDSLGGTWKTTGDKEKIFDSNNMMIGYKNELAYYKKVKGQGTKDKGEISGWCMTEYWLESESNSVFQEVVLCHLRDTKNKNHIFVDQSQDSVQVMNPNYDLIVPQDSTFMIPYGVNQLQQPQIFLPEDNSRLVPGEYNIVVDQSQLQPQIFTQEAVQVMNPNYDLIVPQDSTFMTPYGVNQLQQPHIFLPEDSRLIQGEYNIVVDQSQVQPQIFTQETVQVMNPNYGLIVQQDSRFMIPYGVNQLQQPQIFLPEDSRLIPGEYNIVFDQAQSQPQIFTQETVQVMNPNYGLIVPQDSTFMIPYGVNQLQQPQILRPEDNSRLIPGEYNIVVEQPQEENCIVTNVFVPGVQNMVYDDSFMFDVEPREMEDENLMYTSEEVKGILEGEDQQPLIPLHDQDLELTREQQNMTPAVEEEDLSDYIYDLENSIEEEDQESQIHPLQDQDSGFTRDQEMDSVGKGDDVLKAHVGMIENLLEEDDDEATQQQYMVPGAEEAYLSNYINALKNILEGREEDQQRPQILPFQDSRFTRGQEVPTGKEDTKEFDELGNLLEAHRTKRRKLS